LPPAIELREILTARVQIEGALPALFAPGFGVDLSETAGECWELKPRNAFQGNLLGTTAVSAGDSIRKYGEYVWSTLHPFALVAEIIFSRWRESVAGELATSNCPHSAAIEAIVGLHSSN
jgi:hypothetical protein